MNFIMKLFDGALQLVYLRIRYIFAAINNARRQLIKIPKLIFPSPHKVYVRINFGGKFGFRAKGREQGFGVAFSRGVTGNGSIGTWNISIVRQQPQACVCVYESECVCVCAREEKTHFNSSRVDWHTLDVAGAIRMKALVWGGVHTHTPVNFALLYFFYICIKIMYYLFIFLFVLVKNKIMINFFKRHVCPHQCIVVI